MPDVRELAATALNKIENHEEICAFRYQNIEAQLESLRGGMKDINKSVIAFSGSTILLLISALAGIIFYMLTHKV